MMSRSWSRWRNDIIGGIFVALALAVIVAISAGTALAEPTAVEHQKLVKAQIGTRGFDPIPDRNQLAGSNDPGRSARSPMSTIVPAPDYDSEPESISRGTEP